MVRKTKASSSCPSDKENSSNNETEKKTLIFLSFPIVMIFNLLKTILFELFIVLKFVYNTSTRILKPQETEVNLETVKADEQNSMDLLQLQKNHHKKAFEFISQALKIDETQNPGENFILSSVSIWSELKCLGEFQIRTNKTNPLMMTHRCVVHMSIAKFH